jgi:hypothetical protein
MRELVLLQVAQRDSQIERQPLPLPAREHRHELLCYAPTEARVADLIRPNAREELAQLALWHLQPLGADQRDRHRFAQARYAEHVAQEAFDAR